MIEMVDGRNQELEQSLAQSKKIDLPGPDSLVKFGRAVFPPYDQLTEMLRLLFPKVVQWEVRPPYLIIRFRELPPKPWPFTTGNLPIQITVQEGEIFKRGKLGLGGKFMEDLNLHDMKSDITRPIMQRVIDHFDQTGVKIRDIFWFTGFWLVTTLERIDRKVLPTKFGGSPVWYKSIEDDPDPEIMTLVDKGPEGLIYDDTNYGTGTFPILSPGIMLSSSSRSMVREGRVEKVWRTSTSGILVRNKAGEQFITASSQGFEADGLVYHPNPQTGQVIGQIIHELTDTGIAIVKLKPGLRYLNEAFGQSPKTKGTDLNGIAPAFHLIHAPITISP